MQDVHPMNGNCAAIMLRRAASVLRVTAGSYGLVPPPRAQRWASGGLLALQQPLHRIHDALEGNRLVQHRDIELPEEADVGG